MASFADVVRFRAVSSGTGNFVVSAAITGYQTPASGQMGDGQLFKYRAESDDLTQWECGYGVYTVSGTSLARTKILFNSAGTQVAISFTAAPQVAIVAYAEDVTPIDGQLFGCTMSTAGASTTMTVAAGFAADSTAVNVMRLAASTAKTTSAWAVGTAQGGLDTSTIAINSWYHFFIIKRLDTGVVDVLFSLSATAPTMPTNYTLFRRIGAGRTNASSQWTQFTQTGDNFFWTTGSLDLNSSTITTSRTLVTLLVPPSTFGIFRAFMTNVTVATGLVIQPTAETDAAVSFTAAPLVSLYEEVTSQGESAHFEIFADASSQIGIRSSNASTTVRIVTFGWIDLRGRQF